MKKSIFILMLVSLLSCAKEEEAPEVVIPEPTSFLEKYNNTIWDNGNGVRIGFVDDTSRFLWTVPLVGDCTFVSNNQSFEADGGVYTVAVSRNIPAEFIYTITFAIGENTASYTKVFTEANDQLTEQSILFINSEQDGEPVEVTYDKLAGTLTTYCN